ncbi:MAG: R3H domain-containing nucleic acid-binding protein [Candidatus Woykebacteria bacterium]
MVKKITTGKIEKEGKELVEKILELLGVEADVLVKGTEEAVRVDIEGNDLGLLIGYRGENIEGFQILLGLILNKKLDEENWKPLILDVGGWRQQREESLRDLVDKEIEGMSGDRKEIELPPMPPAQRRTVHLLVSEHEGLKSESIGEAADRRVVIKKIN